MPMDLRSSMIGLTGTRPSTSSKQREIVGKLSFGQPLTAKEWKYYGRSKSAAAETQRMLDSQKAQQDRWLELTDIAGKKTGNPLLAPRVTGEDGTRWNNMSGANGHNTGNPLLAPLNQPKSIGLDSAFEEIRKQRESDVQSQENARLLSKFGSADFGREFNRQHALGTLRNQNLASEHLASNIASTRFNQQRLQSELDAQREARKQKDILDSYMLIVKQNGREIADEWVRGLPLSNETKLRILDFWDKKAQAEIQAKRDAEMADLEHQKKIADLTSTNLKNDKMSSPFETYIDNDGNKTTYYRNSAGGITPVKPMPKERFLDNVTRIMKETIVEIPDGGTGMKKYIIGPDRRLYELNNKAVLEDILNFYMTHGGADPEEFQEALKNFNPLGNSIQNNAKDRVKSVKESVKYRDNIDY